MRAQLSMAGFAGFNLAAFLAGAIFFAGTALAPNAAAAETDEATWTRELVAALNAQDWNAAQAQLDALRQQGEKSIELARYQGLLYLLSADDDNRGERYHLAAQQLETYLRSTPGDWQSLQFLLDAHQALGRTADSTAFLQQHLRQHPDHAVALLRLANLHLQAGRTDEAIDSLQRLAGVAPTTPGLWHTLTMLHQQRGENEMASATAWSGVRHQPMDRTAWLSLVNRLGAVGEYERALIAMDVAAQIDAGVLEDAARYSILAASGAQGSLIAAALLGEFPLEDGLTGQIDAPTQLKAILNLDGPEREERLNGLMKDWLQAQPESPWAQALLGYQMMRAQQYPQARTALEGALRGDAALELAWWLAWRLYRITENAQGQLRVAEAMLERPETLGSLWRFRRAHALYRTGQYEAGIEAARTALDDFPEHPFARIELVDALLQLGRRREAMHAYLDAEAAMPGLPNPLFRAIALPEANPSPQAVNP